MIGIAMVLALVGFCLVMLALSMSSFDPVNRRIKLILGLAILAVALVLFLIANPARADDGTEPSLSGIELTEGTCAITAAMVGTARSLALAGVDLETAKKAMAYMFDVRDPRGVRSTDTERTRNEITDLAYRRTGEPGALAAAWALVCVRLVHSAKGARMSRRL